MDLKDLWMGRSTDDARVSSQRRMGMDNVLISPHCTDRTRNPDWLDGSALVFVDNFRRYLNGEALSNVVDKEAGY